LHDRIDACARAREIIEEDVRRAPENPDAAGELAVVEMVEADCLALLQNYDRSLAMHLRARDQFERDIEKHPPNWSAVNLMLQNDVGTGIVQQAMGRNSEAALTLQRARNEAEKWLERFPGNPAILYRLIQAANRQRIVES
ncbi:MAG TPA: hypothetical protein VHR43_14015, partial [Gemmatimonadales bacterium]|nr:hypothetical protein [Gemmatimonadales bacterium]